MTLNQHQCSRHGLTWIVHDVDIVANPFDVIQEINRRLVLGTVHFAIDDIQMDWIHDATILNCLPMIVVIVLIETIELLEMCMIYVLVSFKYYSMCSLFALVYYFLHNTFTS